MREERYKGPVDVGGSHDTARYMIRRPASECHGIELKGDKDPKDGSGPPDLSIVSAIRSSSSAICLRTGEPAGGRKLEPGAPGVSRGAGSSGLTDAEVDA